MKWRLELCHKDSSQLHSVLSLLRERPELCRSLDGFNVPNKSKGRKFLHDTSRWLGASDDFHRLRKESGTDVVVHYSMKYQAPERNTRETCVSDFLKLNTRDCYRGGVLVVTGSKPRKNDSLSLLRSLQDRGSKGLPLLHCAFNPYLVDKKQREGEYKRLRSKLETGLCSGVWLQIGTDLELLEKGLAFIRSLEGKTKTVEEVKVYGGVYDICRARSNDLTRLAPLFADAPLPFLSTQLPAYPGLQDFFCLRSSCSRSRGSGHGRALGSVKSTSPL